MGAGFSHDFAQGTPTNSGVTKHDSPTADHAVGASAEVGWQQLHARNGVKQAIREKSGARALTRQDKQDHIEYEAARPGLIPLRKQLVRKANEIYQDEAKGRAQ